MTTADLGTVQVTISGKDVGLGQVMREASQAMQQAAQGAQTLTQSLTKQEAADERAKAASLAYISAIVKQRGAVGQLDSAMGILTKNSLQFAGETITAARYSALYQTTLQASRQAAIDLAAANVKLAIGTEGFSDALDKLMVEFNNLDNTTNQYINTLNKINDLNKQNTAALNKRAQEEERARQKIQQGAVATLQKAQADARAQAAAKNHIQAIRDLQTSLNTLEKEFGDVITKTVQWSNAQAQLARYQKQTDSDSRRLNGTLFAAVKGLNSYVGAAYALNAVFTNVGAVITAGNELEKITSTIRALSKTQERFNEVMDAAANQQKLYGGSLRENLDDLSGFIYISNQTGIAVDRLADAARRLAIIDPVQGMKGASVALKEFFSGDITSLSRRFEIDRTTLNGIKTLTTAGERLQGLEELLTDMGIGMGILNERTQLTATTWDKLAGSFGNAYDNAGQFLSLRFEHVAEKTSNAFSIVANIIDKVNKQFVELGKEIDSQNTAILEGVIKSGGGFDSYNEQMINLIMKANVLGVSLKQFTKTQIDLASELYKTGTSLQDVITYIQQYENLINRVGENTRNLQNIQSGEIDTLAKLQTWLVQNIVLYPELENNIINYTVAMENGTVLTNDAIVAISRLIQAEIDRKAALELSRQTMESAQDVVRSFIDENNALIQSEIAATAQSQLLSEANQLLTFYAELAASGMLGAGEAALIMASRFNIAKGDALLLIEALKQVKSWQNETDLINILQGEGFSGSEASNLVQQYIDLGLDLEDQKKIWEDHIKAKEEAAKLAEEEAKAIADAADAQADYEFSLLTTTDKITALNAKLKGLTTSNKEYWSTLSQIKQLEEQLARERAGTGGGGGSTATKEEQVTELEKLLYELSDIRTEFYSDMEDAEKEYQQNVLDIQKEFARKQKEAEQANERDKRRSRASFYQSLTDVEGIDVTTFSAQYEQIFLEAQRIAQEGKAALSKEFLDLRQSQLQEMIDLEKEMADVRTDKDLPETTKQAKLEYLQGIKKLLEDAQAEELKQLMEGGDKNQTELTDQLAEEAKQYGEQTQKIATAAKDQADAKITAAERSKKVIGEENQLLQKQLDLYYDIYKLLGKDAANKAVGITTNSVPPALAPGAPTAPAATEYTVPELKIDTPNVIIQAPQPSAIAPSNATPTAVTSMQALSEVHDRVLTATLQTIGARLESKLAEVITAVYDSAGTTVDAIGKIRLPAPQIVSR